MLGEALRLIRVFHDKKLVNLAKDLGISPGYLSEIENQKKEPSLEIVNKYAKAFETTPSAILFFSEQLDKKGAGGKTKAVIRDHLIKFMQAVERAAKEQ